MVITKEKVFIKERQVGRFISSLCKYTKKLFTIQLENYEKQLTNLWSQGQHKKAGIAQLYFHCGPLGKMIYRKIKNIYKEET